MPELRVLHELFDGMDVPWTHDGTFIWAAGQSAGMGDPVGRTLREGDGERIVAAINSMPVLLAKVEELKLAPAERIALTVAKAQVARGDEVTPNIAAVCVMALARIEADHG